MIEKIKKTAEAYGTVSEEKALKEAKDSKKSTEKIIKKIEETEKDKFEKEKREEIERLEILEKKELKEKKYKKNEEDLKESWEPKTKLGKEVKSGKIKNIDEILDNNQIILEEEITDYLLDVKSDLISIGQAKGKFGGGKRRAWRQTQRKTEEGNVLTFSSMAIVGDENGHIEIGRASCRERV